LRVGLELGAELAAHPAPTLGGRVVYRLTDVAELAGRVAWTRRGDDPSTPSAIGGGLGLAAILAHTPAFGLSVGASPYVEVRFDDRMVGRTGLAGELDADLAFRGAPMALGVRVQRWLAGGILDTRAVLGVSVELR
jgi:hypothetical protein